MDFVSVRGFSVAAVMEEGYGKAHVFRFMQLQLNGYLRERHHKFDVLWKEKWTSTETNYIGFVKVAHS